MGKFIGIFVSGIGAVLAFEGIKFLTYGGIVYSLLYFALGAVFLYIGLGLLSNNKNTNKKNNYQRTSTPSHARGRLCFDCKHCNANRIKNEQIYCNWDSEYYFPETGLNCDDFNK